MPELLDQLTEIVPSASNLEELARPILEVMHTITGMESTYFTTIDTDRGVQNVKYASNSGTMVIPENLEVPWNDTLCKRALDEGRMFENDVANCWGDSDAAKALGIKTYLSTAVKNSEGLVLGTLCAASADSHELNNRSLATMGLFSKLLSLYMERELLVKRLSHQNGKLSSQAMHDHLTGLPNRRAFDEAFPRLLKKCGILDTHLFVSMIDLDGFKRINDVHGHSSGDRFLQQIADRLTSTMREDDFIARIGGDEFVVLSPSSLKPGSPVVDHEEAIRVRLTNATIGDYALEDGTLHYAGPSVGVIPVAPGSMSPEQAIILADEKMYVVKKARKAAAAQGDSR